jgi:hypothetical protein
MLTRLHVERFKSLVKLDLELGRVNLFIGSNGSGKSNLLEALGVLGAAAFGRVEDESLLRRGVRPGVPRLYKTAFSLSTSENTSHILFGGEESGGASFSVTLWNPLNNPSPAWRYKTENLRVADETVITRTTTSAGRHNQEQGMAALKTVELAPSHAAVRLMDLLRGYSIYCPNTPSLRGLTQDLQARDPVGLSGGRLPEAVGELLAAAEDDGLLAELVEEVRHLIDWAKDFSSAPSTKVPLSPAAARSRLVIEFVDRYMAKKRNRLTGYDASEGALYILFVAVLTMHANSPRCLAIDNFDQALNPRLAQRLMEKVCTWTARQNSGRQLLLTAHNPAILDGLPLDDSGVRLFAIERNNKGHTVVRRIDLAGALAARPDAAWTLSRMWLNGLLGAVPSV